MHPDVARWLPETETMNQTLNPLTLPFHVALNEAVECARFFSARWEPQGTLPGLRRLSKSKLPATTGDEILSLARAIQETQTRYLLAVDPGVVDLGSRARSLIDTLESALRFLLDDGIDEPADIQLAQIRETRSQSGERSDALAQSLHDYASLADTLRARLVDMDEDFPPAIIDEAKELAVQLRERPAHSYQEAEAAKSLRILRNRLLVLLQSRVRAVRLGAGYVFSGYPEIAREVSSAYERKRRAARLKSKEEPTTETPGKD
jgi:hypothetical protein